MSPIIQLQGIAKRFGSVEALKGVDFRVDQGSIHALVGENGAGKTTLMNILYGSLSADSGDILVAGQPVSFKSSSDAIRAHIGMVSQHYSIIPELTCIENLILGAEPTLFLNKKLLIERAELLARQMNFSFSWNELASTLSPAGAQKLEILKLLWRNAKIMILDEPTAMLSPADSDALYVSLRRLARDGATIVVVTHRLPEVLGNCDHVTVLRGGQKITDKPVSETNAQELAELIVGHAIKPSSFRKVGFGEVVLEVKGLKVLGDRGNEALKGVDFQVHAGEVLGIAGVDGNGQRELFHALTGVTKAFDGVINLNNSNITDSSPEARIQNGIRLIPEDRVAEGVISSWGLFDNASLSFQRLPEISNGIWLNQIEREKLFDRVSKKFNTKHNGPNTKMGHLSGGNQQRFVAARALQFNPKLILAFQPSRGLDIDGSAQVYEAIREACARGSAAIVVSFDLDELLMECDRVVAINLGKVYKPVEGQEKDRMAIGRLMVGVS